MLPFKNPLPSAYCFEHIFEHLAQREENPNLIVLAGPPGTGKTWDACGIVRHFCRTRGNFRLTDCVELHRADDDTLEWLQDCTALILDDYGTRKTEGALLRAFSLVKARMYDNKKVTVITTNLIEEIRELDEAMASRFNAACIVLYTGKPDLREVPHGQT